MTPLAEGIYRPTNTFLHSEKYSYSDVLTLVDEDGYWICPFVGCKVKTMEREKIWKHLRTATHSYLPGCVPVFKNLNISNWPDFFPTTGLVIDKFTHFAFCRVLQEIIPKSKILDLCKTCISFELLASNQFPDCVEQIQIEWIDGSRLFVVAKKYTMNYGQSCSAKAQPSFKISNHDICYPNWMLFKYNGTTHCILIPANLRPSQSSTQTNRKLLITPLMANVFNKWF